MDLGKKKNIWGCPPVEGMWQKFFYPGKKQMDSVAKLYLGKNLSWKKIILAKIYPGKNYFGKNLSWKKIILAKIYPGKKLYWQKFILEKIILAKIYPGKNIWAKKSEGPVRVSTSSRDVGALLGNAAIWFHYTLLHYHQHLSISLPSNYCSISQNWSTVFGQCDWVYFPPTDFNICVTPDWIAPNICPYYSSAELHFGSTIFH